MEAHGTYTIELVDKVLIVNVQGPFNDEAVKDYQSSLKGFVERLSSKSWALCGIFRDEGLLIPGAEIKLIEATRWRKEKGMKVVANVFKNIQELHILEAQMAKVYNTADIQYHFFYKTRDALSWLAEKGYPSYPQNSRN